MLIRTICLILLVCTGCQTGIIPCAKVKPDRLKRSYVKKVRYIDKSASASARTVPSHNLSHTDGKPSLTNIDVEEWECPKPGVKRNLPKALKDNIKKNKKAYETYYRNKADSASAAHSVKLR